MARVIVGLSIAACLGACLPRELGFESSGGEAVGGAESGGAGGFGGMGAGHAGGALGAGGGSNDAGGAAGAGGGSPHVSSSLYREAVLSDGPVAYWRLGEASGTTAHDDMGSNHGLYVGGVALGAPGALANDPDFAVQFESGSVVIGDVFDFPGRAAFSLEVWVLMPNAVGGVHRENYLIAKYGSRGGYHLHVNSGGDLSLDRGDESGWETLHVPFGPSDDFRHVVVTFDGEVGRIYLDGIQAATRSLTRQAGDTPESLRVGHSDAYSDPYSYYQGTLDEVAIYDFALPAERVRAHYVAGRALP